VSSEQPPPPLVIMLGWMLCKPQHLLSYLRLYNSIGWDALGVVPSARYLWWSSGADGLAFRVLDKVQKELESSGPRPVVVSAFSGAPKACYYRLLSLLRSDSSQFKLVRSNLSGQCYDSGPVDFKSQHGLRFLVPPSKSTFVARAAAQALAGVLDATLGGRFERERAEMWHILEQPVPLPPSAPTLFLYCENDELAPASTIEAFAERLRAGGWEVMAPKCWSQSEHVGHLRLHPQQYRTAVSDWLRQAHEAWTASRRRQNPDEGRYDWGHQPADVAAAGQCKPSRLHSNDYELLHHPTTSANGSSVQRAIKQSHDVFQDGERNAEGGHEMSYGTSFTNHHCSSNSSNRVNDEERRNKCKRPHNIQCCGGDDNVFAGQALPQVHGMAMKIAARL